MSDLQTTHHELLTWIGDHATEGTSHTLRRMLEKASEADIVSVRASLTNAEPDDRARWLVAALRNARAERLAEREDATTNGDLLRLVRRIEGTISDAEAQLADLRAMVARAPIPERPARYACPVCNVKRSGPNELADHMRNVHDITAAA